MATSVNRFDNKQNISRRTTLKAFGSLLASASLPRPAIAEYALAQAAQRGSQRAPKTQLDKQRPNILWITGEGVPVSALSCYGSRLIDTPNIDRIANEGMRFRNAFTTNALCAPSRATLLTGQYSHINGTIANPNMKVIASEPPPTFDESQVTITKLLKQNGYQTGMVGKWHLPANPGKVGFDYFIYKEGAGGPYYQAEGYLGNSKLGSDVIEKQRHVGYETDITTDLAIEGIKQFTQPFLMMVQYFNAHRPFEPPHKYEHIYDGKHIPEPSTFWDDYSHRATPASAARMRIADMEDFSPPKDLTERQRKQWNYQQFMAHFLGTLRSQDDNIGRLFEFLDRSGLAENTIVVYTCDHGFFLGDHGWFDKRFMYEQALRVPFMVWAPGRVKAGTVRDEFLVNVDNAPTVLDLVGLPIPTPMQGRSILPLLHGDTSGDWRKSVYYHYYEFGDPHWVEPHYGIRTERYKLISYYNINQWELFDLEKDPDEMESLCLNGAWRIQPGYEAVAKDLLEQLKQIRDFYRDTTGVPVELIPIHD
jgi:arylsulfatase A-like enzyme